MHATLTSTTLPQPQPQPSFLFLLFFFFPSRRPQPAANSFFFSFFLFFLLPSHIKQTRIRSRTCRACSSLLLFSHQTRGRTN
uniref:Uncharacterized protein n=1 Tax=Oryza nivara TaxID=4536 RepID=A0A0E0GH15_ORYNI